MIIFLSANIIEMSERKIRGDLPSQFGSSPMNYLVGMVLFERLPFLGKFVFHVFESYFLFIT
jgi:hypothetical protein